METHNQNQDKRPEINLNRFRKHQRNIPWGLIRKIIIGLALVGLMWYFIQQKKEAESIENNKQENEVESIENNKQENEVEVDIEL